MRLRQAQLCGEGVASPADARASIGPDKPDDTAATRMTAIKAIKPSFAGDGSRLRLPLLDTALGEPAAVAAVGGAGMDWSADNRAAIPK